MKNTLALVKEAIIDLHNDEQGAEGLEKLLILAAIALPLLGLLIYFAGELSEWAQGHWDSVRGEAASPQDFY